MYLVCLVRWGNTPLDDALQFGHSGVVTVLQEYQKGYSDTEAQPEAEEQKATLDTVKVVVWAKWEAGSVMERKKSFYSVQH